MLVASVRFRHAIAAALVALAPVLACAPVVPASANSAPSAAESTTLLVRLGADTIGVEQFTRTATRMEGVLVQRAPFTTIARYSVDLGPNDVPVHAEYSLRRGDGTAITGQMQSLSVRYSADSVTFIGHRTGGDTSRTAAVKGELLPYLNGSYGLLELALTRLLSSRRDSATFAVAPLSGALAARHHFRYGSSDVIPRASPGSAHRFTCDMTGAATFSGSTAAGPRSRSGSIAWRPWRPTHSRASGRRAIRRPASRGPHPRATPRAR